MTVDFLFSCYFELVIRSRSILIEALQEKVQELGLCVKQI